MCDRPKIHVFLGAPPPSSGLLSESTAGGEGEECSPPQWRHLQLTWQGGHLRPAGDEAGNPVGLSSEDNNTADRYTPNQGGIMGTDQDESSSNVDWTSDVAGARRKRGQSSFEFGAEEDHSSHAPQTAGGALRGNSESHPEMEAPCSASVHEYLDSSFPAAQVAVEHSSNSQSHSPSPLLSPYTHFLQTWTLSQALVLRGKTGNQSAMSPEKDNSQTLPKDTQSPPSVSSSTPELFSPVTPSPAASAELFSHVWPSPRVEEGGIVLEVTTEGILCSQQGVQEEPKAAQTSSLSPSSKSPDLKRTRVSGNPAFEASAVVSHHRASVGLQASTTPLIHCDKQGLRYSALVAVVHPCHLRELKIKSGRAAGSYVPLASIAVTDQSGVEKKVVLWRRAAFWVLTVTPGDILLITGLQVNEDRWRGETVLQSTFSSKLLNLGQACSSSLPVPQSVNPHSLSVLRGFLREQRPLLVCPSRLPPQDTTRLPYATLRCLRVNTLVHALLRVTHTHISTAWRSEADSRWRSAAQLKAILTVDQPGEQQGTLVLWGAALDWLPRFKHARAAVWDFHLLLVREGLTSDLLELHSTPWSSVQPLEPAQRVQDFLRAGSARRAATGAIELDLDTLLSQKYSGTVELRVQITAFSFQSPPASQHAQRLLDSTTPLDNIVAALSGDVTYTDCGRCAAELDTDVNGIYCPCYPCLPHTAVRRYYRPGVLTVNGQGIAQVCVQVPPVQLQDILEVPPDRLHSSSAPGSDRKQSHVAAERIQRLVSLPRTPVSITVQSHFLCDENSVALSQDLTLLSLCFPS